MSVGHIFKSFLIYLACHWLSFKEINEPKEEDIRDYELKAGLIYIYKYNVGPNCICLVAKCI